MVMRNFLLILDGPTGAGKTTAANAVHPLFPRTALLGMDRVKWAISHYKRISRNNAIVNDVIFAMTKEFLKHHLNVIVEQGFREGVVEAYQSLGNKLGVKVVTIQLTASRKVLLSRIVARRKTAEALQHPLLPMSRILRNIRRHGAKRPIRGLVVDTTLLRPRQVAAIIVGYIKKPSRP